MAAFQRIKALTRHERIFIRGKAATSVQEPVLVGITGFWRRLAGVPPKGERVDLIGPSHAEQKYNYLCAVQRENRKT